MTDTLPVTFLLATDRPTFHDDTRCPEGNTIMLKDRRLGDGGRDPCQHCAQYLSQRRSVGVGHGGEGDHARHCAPAEPAPRECRLRGARDPGGGRPAGANPIAARVSSPLLADLLIRGKAVGIPSGRWPTPPDFGIITRLTGCGV